MSLAPNYGQFGYLRKGFYFWINNLLFSAFEQNQSNCTQSGNKRKFLENKRKDCFYRDVVPHFKKRYE
ncbi:MAG: hypothetical protein EAZ08_05215 [Cytophagales bacterium]|nr:MAG: hypothetical protein EAZ08_05215 [Cytophagales bacterium]